MNKRNKTVIWLWGAILVILVLSSQLSKVHESIALIAKISFIIFCTSPIIIISLFFFERHHLRKNSDLIGKDIDQLIKFYENRTNKYWSYPLVTYCKFQIAVWYLMKNEVELARKELLSYKIKYAQKFTIYPIFILAVIEDDTERLNESYNRLMNFKSPVFNTWKDGAIRILQMIETEVYDEKIFNETNYLGIKELCLKYKQ